MKKKTLAVMFTCMISACLVMGCSKNVVTENPAAAPDVESTVVTPTPETPDAPVDTPTTPVVVPDVYSEQDDINPDVNPISFEGVSVGDIVTFGEYEQDGNTSNGKERIEWIVLDDKGDRLMLISKYILDCKEHESDEYSWESWEGCSLRKFLNEDFYNFAFSDQEKEKILKSSNPNKGFSDTQDYVFILSAEEVRKYYTFNSSNGDNYYSDSLITTPTQYAINSGVDCYTITQDDYNEKLKDSGYPDSVIGMQASPWWLRDVETEGFAYYIRAFGTFGNYTQAYTTGLGVRPVIYVYK